MIYTPPEWYTEKLSPQSEDCCISMDDIDPEDVFMSLDKMRKFEEWVIENVWDGNSDDSEAIGARLAFLLELREHNFDKYRPMSDEKEFIYELQNDRPEIYDFYLKWEKQFEGWFKHGKVD